MARLIPFILLSLLIAGSLHAEPRTWHNSDGSRTFTGEYVSHDTRQVTIRRADGRVFTLELSQLHPEDQAWLRERKSPGPSPDASFFPEGGALFDTLHLGDTHADVMAKLRASKALELTVPEIYLARMGLDRSFRTRQQIGGLRCVLTFDWDASSRLTELTLQTEPQTEAAYSSQLKTVWSELVQLMSTRHGQPANAAPYPDASQLTGDRMVLGSHLWKTEAYSILIGTAREGENYSVIIRFNSLDSAPAAPKQ